MKFEKTTLVRTPDGKDHASVEAAQRHMFALNYGILGNATSADFEDAVNHRESPSDSLVALRNALRDVFLAAWPRASKGKTREAKGTEPTQGGAAESEGEAGEEPAGVPEADAPSLSGEALAAALTGEQPAAEQPAAAPVKQKGKR